MPKKASSDSSRPSRSTRVDRRRFLEGMAFGASTATLLGGLGIPGSAAAQARMGSAPQMTASQPPPLKDLAGKVAYITAASDGIGLGIARAMSAAGMKVAIGYRHEKRLELALPLFKPGNPGVLPIKHDVTDREGWQRMLEQVKAKWGKLHVLVNNAGVKTLRKASEAKSDEWDNAVAVNFTGIYNGVAAVLPHMLEHGEGGHIVTTASMGGILPGSTAGVYTATKMAAVGLMEALRIELEATSVGTSVFCPGLVNTDNYPPGKRPGDAPTRRFPRVGMDPLEAGERVINGIRNNDLFILSHPEFKPGMQERFDAILASVPDEPVPPERLKFETVVLHAGIYPREIAHRRVRRRSYRG